MKNKLLLLAVIILAVALRSYKIDNPLADWHSFRQADTASVTREYLKHGIDLLHPTYHDLSNIQSGKDNPRGYRMVEFPLVNALTAFIINISNSQSQQVLVGRYLSVGFSIITLLSLYWLGSLLSGKLTGLSAAFTFAILPYSVYYSRVILPDPALIALSTLSLALLAQYLKSNQLLFYLLSAITFSLALLVKPYAIFLIPVYFALIIWSGRYLVLLSAPLILGLFSLPLFWWRHWILQFPTGIAASDWLYNKDNIRFKGAFFHWLFDVRLTNLILGNGGLVLFILGLINKGKDSLVYLVWGICLLAYLSILAGGNVQHDYYQIFLLPFICLAVGRGVNFLNDLVPTYISRFAFLTTILILTVFSLFISWYTIRGYYQINNWSIIEAGQQVDKLTPSDAKVIAPYFGDTAFLFATNRTGWPIGYYIDDKIKMGATTYVTVSYDDEAHLLEKQYPTLAKTDRYLIFDLTQPK